MSEAKKILIVEDDFDLAEMLNAYFKAQGYDVRTANWGEDAVKIATEIVPDLVVLDIRLPDIDGYEVCRRLRQDRQTLAVPVIFLTERRERENKLAGLELGAVDYITKPFDIQELRLRVRNTLRRYQLDSLVNPVTSLPEGLLVQENLERMLRRSDWGLVLARIRGLDKFRDEYGFVAADDVARAISLMITNALQESKADNPFVGHTDTVDFAIITTVDQLKQVADSCRIRLETSIQYFYPALDRSRVNQLPRDQKLHVEISTVSSADGDFQSLDELQLAMMVMA